MKLRVSLRIRNYNVNYQPNNLSDMHDATTNNRTIDRCGTLKPIVSELSRNRISGGPGR